MVPFAELNVGGYSQLASSRRQVRIQEDFERFLTARAELLVEPISLLCEGVRWP
jgi:hypothetical protein